MGIPKTPYLSSRDSHLHKLQITTFTQKFHITWSVHVRCTYLKELRQLQKMGYPQSLTLHFLMSFLYPFAASFVWVNV